MSAENVQRQQLVELVGKWTERDVNLSAMQQVAPDEIVVEKDRS